MFFLFFLSLLSSFVFTAILLFVLKKYKLKQTERLEGPQSHKTKAGTPTMGGIGFIIVAAVLSFVFADPLYFPVIFLFLGYALIGLTDDLVKIIKHQNLGLTFWQKIISQVIIAALFSWQWGVPYFFFLVFLIVGTANAANLTDGLDGLLTGTAVIAFAAFTVIAFKNYYFGGAMFCLIFIGALLGFLPFNFPRSKIFMGDTGSLAIGAALAGLAIVMQCELALAVIGFVFLVEALSVIIQVASYKMFKKRIFLMAPLHHHFELMGLSEFKVVMLFWTVEAAAGIVAAVLL